MSLYINGEIKIGLEKESFKIQNAEHSEEMSELILSLGSAKKLYTELSVYFSDIPKRETSPIDFC